MVLAKSPEVLGKQRINFFANAKNVKRVRSKLKRQEIGQRHVCRLKGSGVGMVGREAIGRMQDGETEELMLLAAMGFYIYINTIPFR